MAVPVLESFQHSEAGADGTSMTFVAPSGIAANDLLLIVIGNDSTGDNANFAVSGWTKTLEVGDGVSDAHAAILWKIATGSEGNVTVTASSDRWANGWYCRISGVDQTTPINVSASGSEGPAATHDAPSVTTDIDDCLAIYFISHDGADGLSFSQPGGWTEQGEAKDDDGVTTTGSSCAFGTKTQATAGATGNATITPAVSDGAAYLQVAIAPAATRRVFVVT